MQKGITYKTPEGLLHEVLEVDEINKMVLVRQYAKNFRWAHENEYNTWVVNDTAVMPKVYVPDIPAQIKTEDDAIQIENAATVDVCEQATNGEGVGEGNTQHEVITEESKVESEEKVEKPKRKTKKKSDGQVES